MLVAGLSAYGLATAGSDCLSGKTQYATKKIAAEAAAAARTARGWPMREYICPYCQCWHIGNSTRATNSKARHRR
jgi:hypothetical protein